MPDHNSGYGRQSEPPGPREFAIYRLLMADSLATLKAVWESLPNDIRRQVVETKDMKKEALRHESTE